jgi:hypothetical protein
MLPDFLNTLYIVHLKARKGTEVREAIQLSQSLPMT